MKTMISVHVDAAIIERLDKLAAAMTAKKERRVTRAELMGKGAVMVLEDLEPYYAQRAEGPTNHDDETERS